MKNGILELWNDGRMERGIMEGWNSGKNGIMEGEEQWNNGGCKD